MCTGSAVNYNTSSQVQTPLKRSLLQVNGEYQANPKFPKFPSTTPQPYAELAKRCLAKDAKDRPIFQAIVAGLQVCVVRVCMCVCVCACACTCAHARAALANTCLAKDAKAQPTFQAIVADRQVCGGQGPWGVVLPLGGRCVCVCVCVCE